MTLARLIAGSIYNAIWCYRTVWLSHLLKSSLLLTVKQLQALVKQRGIGIARTKSDFLRIIKEKNPEEDLEPLKGKVLFDRVSELHISRLRTKEDLVRMLSA